MKWVAVIIGLCVVAGALAWAFGPREPVDREIAFDPDEIGTDLDAWLAAREAGVPNLRDAATKRIVWAGAPGTRTAVSVVYVHGFSASAEEIRPVPDAVAARLGANLYFARLTGHGRDGAAMAEPTAGDWIEDLAEAVEIGRRIGDRVILIGTSTGGTLVALAAHDATLGQDVAGIVFVSPNFRIGSVLAPVLSLPWARSWVPAVFGEERSFEPLNERHEAHWTTRYPSVAVLPMAALVDHVRTLDHGVAEIPALFLYSEHDKVISPAAVGAAAAAWGGPVTLHGLVMAEGDDPSAHVIAGDITSPGQTERAIELMVEWASKL